jgi:predicted nucleic acid-binding protein
MPDKKWVFDTVALSNFLLSESLYILEKRYRKRAIITWEVYDEITAGMQAYPQLKDIDKLIDKKIFMLISLTRKEHKNYLELIGHLGKGEASCIACARGQTAIVVTDDRTARKQCTSMKIPFTGTVGILKASMLDGQMSLSRADKILLKMRNAGFYSPVRSISDIS